MPCSRRQAGDCVTCPSYPSIWLRERSVRNVHEIVIAPGTLFCVPTNKAPARLAPLSPTPPPVLASRLRVPLVRLARQSPRQDPPRMSLSLLPALPSIAAH